MQKNMLRAHSIPKVFTIRPDFQKRQCARSTVNLVTARGLKEEDENSWRRMLTREIHRNKKKWHWTRCFKYKILFSYYYIRVEHLLLLRLATRRSIQLTMREFRSNFIIFKCKIRDFHVFSKKYWRKHYSKKIEKNHNFLDIQPPMLPLGL